MKEIRSITHPGQKFIPDPTCSLWELKEKGLNLNARSKSFSFSYSFDNNFDNNSKSFRWTGKTHEGEDIETTLQMRQIESDTLEMSFTSRMEDCKTGYG